MTFGIRDTPELLSPSTPVMMRKTNVHRVCAVNDNLHVHPEWQQHNSATRRLCAETRVHFIGTSRSRVWQQETSRQLGG